MTFIEQFEKDFAQRLDHLNYGKTDEQEVIRWACERVLESYRNGITAGQKGTTVKRQGESRRRDIYGSRKYLSGTAHSESIRRGLAFKKRLEEEGKK